MFQADGNIRYCASEYIKTTINTLEDLSARPFLPVLNKFNSKSNTDKYHLFLDGNDKKLLGRINNSHLTYDIHANISAITQLKKCIKLLGLLEINKRKYI